MPSLNLKDLYDATLTDQAFAQSVARWLSAKTEKSQEIINAAVKVMTMDSEEAEAYIESLDSSLKSKTLVLFSDDPLEESSSHTVEDILNALNGEEVIGLSEEEAELIIDDLSGSTAAVIAASVGVSELCSKTVVSSSDLVASIESTVGGLSDQMLSVTSVITPTLASETMSVGDKVRNVLASLGLYNPNGTYSGFGPILSDLHDFTGVSGIQAFCTEVITLTSQPKAIVEAVWNFVGGAVSKVFGGVLTAAKDQILEIGGTLAGVTDATIVRETGKYTDYTCDYANTYMTFPSSIFTTSQLSKISHKTALHVNAGFGSIDMWYADENQETVNVVIHWAPVSGKRAYVLINTIALASGSTHVYTPNGLMTSSSEYDSAFYLLTEALRGNVPNISADVAHQSFAQLFNSEPSTGSAGVSDRELLLGIFFSQMFALAFMSVITSHNLGQNFSAQALFVGFCVYHTLSSITNVDLIRVAAMCIDSTSVGPDIIHNLRATDVADHDFAACLADFFRDTLTEIVNFSVDDQNSFFIPYYYISSYVTGKYAIRSDTQVINTISNIFWFVGAVVVTLLVITTALTIKKNLWVAQNSLDYQLFEQDIGSNPRAANQLYKKACRIDRANNIVSMITGSVKSTVSKLGSTLVGLTNAITGRLGGLLGSGSMDAPSSHDPASLESIKRLIVGR